MTLFFPGFSSFLPTISSCPVSVLLLMGGKPNSQAHVRVSSTCTIVLKQQHCHIAKQTSVCEDNASALEISNQETQHFHTTGTIFTATCWDLRLVSASCCCCAETLLFLLATLRALTLTSCAGAFSCLARTMVPPGFHPPLTRTQGDAVALAVQSQAPA